MNFAALKFGEAGVDVLKSLRPLIVALVPGQQRSLDKLKAMRIQLSNEVADLINEFGPKLYENFDEWRILVPSASVPPSSGASGVWRRKSGTGAVDAQGNLLIHPMTWIDERLFGWSRSADRGTSVWGGSSVEEVSRAVTPDGTDDEDAGDYDNVLGFIPTFQEQPNAQKSRSGQSSYADLQKLRMAAADGQQYEYGPEHPARNTSSSLLPSPPAEIDGLHFRQGHRDRKKSLSDGVSVGRIAALDRREPFEDATHDIYNEIRHRKPDQAPYDD
jgi:glycerol-3-phosphate O-acyltransferase/dihydroxyacetone phosphate acyltransferase